MCSAPPLRPPRPAPFVTDCMKLLKEFIDTVRRREDSEELIDSLPTPS